MRNLFDIFEKLKLNKENGLFITANENWLDECSFSSRIEKLIKEKLKPDAFFVFDNKPLILFYDAHSNKEEIHKALWNFNESPIIVFVDNGKIEIYNGFRYLKEKSSLELFAGEECLNDFNYFEIVSGKTWEKYQSWLRYESRVDYHLLKNIKAAREILISKNQLVPNIANALIGKVIFVRYLIDRNIKIGFEGERYWSNEDFCSLLANRNQTIEFFKYLEKKFNGDMFKLEDSEYQDINTDSLKTIISLLNEDDLGNGQQSLFKLYDFSIIPIEFISNVYESFIGESNQEKEGAYYTPLFLVDYILNETVEKFHDNNKEEYNCKVLDPACGSGIFLVESLRKIIERYIHLNPNIKEDSEEFKEALRLLAIDNIFGIDKNLSAIQVAIFSIQLTLLDYQKPSSIETFKFPKLLNTNFFEADFFDIKHDYNEILRKKELNFIIGNPPWKRGLGEEKPLFDLYIQKRKSEEREKGSLILPEIGGKEIAQSFLLRVSNFNVKNESALIVTSKVLYNKNETAKRFREYFLTNYSIRKVLELAPVRREVFDKSADKSISPAAVLFFTYSANNKERNNNVIEHLTIKPSRFFRLFKIFTLTRSDIKKIEQSKLRDNDWLWKVIVYGSYYDYNFLERLKSQYSKISDIVFHGSDYIVKQGIKRKDGTKKIDVSELKDFDFIDLSKKQIEQFAIADNLQKWNINTVGYVYRERNEICQDMFSPPVLLIKETVKTDLESIAAISNKKVVFTDKITSIKKRDGSDDLNYYNLAALFNSKLFSYFICHFASTTGIMIEQQIHDIERFSFPYISNPKFRNLIQEYEKHRMKGNWDELTKYKNELNKLVEESFNLSETELVLVDYTINYVIPQMMNHNTVKSIYKPILENNNSILIDYAKLFQKRFSSSLNTDNKKFIIEIWHSKQVIGMFFKVIPTSEKQDTIVWIDKSKDELLRIAISLSSQKVTDKLFVQKDLRGFEKDFFYIFKPNEKRLWHMAIGYQDVEEFMGAILKTGRRKYAGE